jgi:hypothetical protein
MAANFWTNFIRKISKYGLVYDSGEKCGPMASCLSISKYHIGEKNHTCFLALGMGVNVCPLKALK